MLPAAGTTSSRHVKVNSLIVAAFYYYGKEIQKDFKLFL
ncbi:hypothetical protein RV13_GL000189 [Enterococcus raffinosus]|nr:hypothetical protein RV13_GL000189 [Enterococcus raffinosus]